MPKSAEVCDEGAPLGGAEAAPRSSPRPGQGFGPKVANRWWLDRAAWFIALGWTAATVGLSMLLPMPFRGPFEMMAGYEVGLAYGVRLVPALLFGRIWAAGPTRTRVGVDAAGRLVSIEGQPIERAVARGANWVRVVLRGGEQTLLFGDPQATAAAFPDAPVDRERLRTPAAAAFVLSAAAGLGPLLLYTPMGPDPVALAVFTCGVYGSVITLWWLILRAPDDASGGHERA